MEQWRMQFTVKATLPEGAEKPNQAEMVKFLFNTLGRKCEEIKCMYLSITGRAIFFRCYKEETMSDLLENYDGAAFKYENGEVARVLMTQESESQKYVRVWGLPPDAPDIDVARFFSNYGEVKRIVREKYPKELNCPIETGVRGICMDLRQELPHFLYIRNFRIKIHYDGMKERCFGCGSTEHIRANCHRNITPASRLVTVDNMRKYGPTEMEQTPVASIATPEADHATTSASTPAEILVTPELSFANVVASVTVSHETASTLSEKSGLNVLDDELFQEPASPTLRKKKTPTHRQQRGRAESRTPVNLRDRSTRSDSSSNGSRGRPKKPKNLPIETIAKGPPSLESSKSAHQANVKSKNVTVDETTNEGPLYDDMMMMFDE
jgi:hypothetical protein